MSYRMALDQGTTSSRCIIFDLTGNMVAAAAKELPQHFPREGWVEHDPMEILETQLAAAREALAISGLTARDIAAIGITNQRETAILWEKKSGKPVCPAIVWQCRRTADACAKLKASGLEPMVREKTGLPIDPYFSATKLTWMLDHIPGARERAMRGELLFGTVDSFLIYHLTGGRVHATDPSNAARTLLFNIHTLKWDEELLRIFDIPAQLLPRVLPSAGLFGETDAHLLGAPIPITGVAGDQQAALFGQCCFDAGEVKNTYGTGGFLLMNTGSEPIRSAHGLLTTVGWQIGKDVCYALEGSVFVCGAAVQWLRDGLGVISSAAEIEALAQGVPDTDGVYFVPALTGLGAPYWDPYARGTIVGISRGTTKAHLARATLEAMAFQTLDVLEAMRRDAQTELHTLRVDGGASANDLLLALQSDLSGLVTERPACIETTALGAANLAGIGCGLYTDLAALRACTKIQKVFTPSISPTQRQKKYDAWQRAVSRARSEY